VLKIQFAQTGKVPLTLPGLSSCDPPHHPEQAGKTVTAMESAFRFLPLDFFPPAGFSLLFRLWPEHSHTGPETPWRFSCRGTPTPSLDNVGAAQPLCWLRLLPVIAFSRFFSKLLTPDRLAVLGISGWPPCGEGALLHSFLPDGP